MDCPHRPACPGCPLAELPYEAQLEAKKGRIARAFARFPHLPPAPDVVGSAWTEAYRHRAKLPVRGGAIGLYAAGEVLDTPGCRVLAPGVAAAIAALRGRLPPEVHSVDVRQSHATGEVQVVLATTGPVDLPALEVASLARSEAAPPRVLGRNPAVLAGKPALEERVGDTAYRLHPGAFFQVDPRQAAVLQGMVRDLAGDARTVLDLYAGVGAYARMLAPGRERVVAVEENAEAARSAADGAPPNLEVLRGRVEDADWAGAFELTVLNPSRLGADPGVLARLGSDRVVYVSCSPETLARDLDALATFGLRVAELRAVDLFPQTREVETVVLLERGRPITRWRAGGGVASGPWRAPGGISGAVGRPDRVVALLVGDTGETGRVPGGRYWRIGVVATHSLVRLETRDLAGALGALSKRGHPVAGRDPRTKRFFAEHAGLVRPFLHAERAGAARARLHGDLVLVLEALGAPDEVMARV